MADELPEATCAETSGASSDGGGRAWLEGAGGMWEGNGEDDGEGGLGSGVIKGVPACRRGREGVTAR